MKLRYRRATFTVEGERTGKCEACGRKGRTEMHHFVYVYKTAVVRKDKKLALENTIELCFVCHKLADCLRNIEEDEERARKTAWAVIGKIRGDCCGNGSRGDT